MLGRRPHSTPSSVRVVLLAVPRSVCLRGVSTRNLPRGTRAAGSEKTCSRFPFTLGTDCLARVVGSVKYTPCNGGFNTDLKLHHLISLGSLLAAFWFVVVERRSIFCFIIVSFVGVIIRKTFNIRNVTVVV